MDSLFLIFGIGQLNCKIATIAKLEKCKYLKKEFFSQVCTIYCDHKSRKWNNYSSIFSYSEEGLQFSFTADSKNIRESC